MDKSKINLAEDDHLYDEKTLSPTVDAAINKSSALVRCNKPKSLNKQASHAASFNFQM